MLIQFDPEILLQGMYATNELTKAYQNHNTQTHTHIDLSVTTLVMEKEYVKAVYCHSAYFTYMQSTS